VRASEAATAFDQVVDSDAVAERFALAERLQFASLPGAWPFLVAFAGQSLILLVLSIRCSFLLFCGKITWRQTMDVLAERLDKKLQEWSPETAEQVRCEVVELIELADGGLLDIARSRKVEQEVLDLIDEPTPR
jgi:hypothetical protein